VPTTIQPTMDKFQIMSEYHRLFVKGGTYFFTVVTYNRQPLLCDEPALIRLKAAFRYVMAKHPYRMDGLVVLLDHLHCIWRLPDDDGNFSVRLARGGRCRWKLENECFNTLKNQGYAIDHSYGHGDKNLCFNFYLLTLIAFAFHQVYELTDKVYQACRQHFGSKKHLWENIRANLRTFIFVNCDYLLAFTLAPEKYITGELPAPS